MSPDLEPRILWDRKVAVQFDTDLFTDLRVSFEVTKTIKGEPNKATISVYNISPEYFNTLLAKKRDLVVKLFAGHGAPVPIFIGNPIKDGVEYLRDGTERVLKIEAKDGYKAYKRTRLALSFGDVITLREVVGRIAAEMGLPADMIDVPTDFEYTQGIQLSGQASKALDRLALSTGSDWSIQDGRLQFLPKSKVRRTTGPLYADRLKNIIQEPSKKEKGINLTTFLDPTLIPGDRFQVEVTDAVAYNGIYKVTALRHTGDTHAEPFYTEIEAKAWKPAPPAENNTPIGQTFIEGGDVRNAVPGFYVGV